MIWFRHRSPITVFDVSTLQQPSFVNFENWSKGVWYLLGDLRYSNADNWDMQ